jgi:tetratricopeptide (TPR) repeat protein
MSARSDRYPGARPFGDTGLDRLRFQGRDAESELLFLQLVGADLLVLFGKPGLGKTSLINARLFPLLRARDFLPLPVRFNQVDSTAAMQVFIAAVKQTCEAVKVDYTPGDPSDLWQFFKTAVFWRGERLQTPVLVLDQFEEIFTLQTEEFRRTAAAELGELVSRRLPDRLRQRLQSNQLLGFSEKAPEVKVLLSLREDDLGMLQELTPQIPTILQNRFRLTPLSLVDARRAIVEPATLVCEDIDFVTAPFEYDPATVEEIVAAARSPCGGIDPFVLQLICGHVERKVLRQQADRNPSPAVTVDSTYLGGEEGMRALTVNFYLDSIKRLPEAGLQRRARCLCEESLLTENGRRRSMLKDEIISRFKLSPESLQLLEKIRLLRSESRDGSLYYEISHDRIAEAIHRSRKWRLPREVQIGVAIIVIATIVVASLFSFYRNELAQAEINKIRTQEAQKAEVEAENARKEADKLIEFMIGDLHNKLQQVGRLSLLEDVNRKVQSYLDSFPSTEESPDVLRGQRVLFNNQGDVLRALGDLGGALTNYRNGLAIAQRLAKKEPVNIHWQGDIAVSYNAIGDILREQGNLTGAFESYHNSFVIDEKLAEQDPDSTPWQSDLALSYEKIGDILHQQGNLTGALRSYRDSLAIRQKLDTQYPGNPAWHHDLAASYERIGDVLRDQGDLKEALDSQNKSLAIRQKLADQDPGNAGLQRDLAASYERIGDVLRGQGDLKEALDSQDKSLAIRQKLADQDLRNAEWQRNLAFSYERVGDVRRDQHDWTRALENYRKSFAIRQKLANQDPGNTGWQSDLAASYERMGDVLRDQGDLNKALESYRESLAIRQKLVNQDPSNATWEGDLALAYWSVGDVGSRIGADSEIDARAMIEEGRDILRSLGKRVGLTVPQKNLLTEIDQRLGQE